MLALALQEYLCSMALVNMTRRKLDHNKERTLEVKVRATAASG